MITQFKTRDEIKKDNVHTAAEFFKDIDKERFVRISMGTATFNDRIFVSNLFIKAKFQLRTIYKNLDHYGAELRGCNKRIEAGLTKDNLIKHETYKKALEDAIEGHRKSLKAYGSHLVDSLITLVNSYFTEHEIIQLVGGTEKAAEELKSTMDRLEIENNRGFTFNLIYHHGEYRWKRGRSKNWIDCDRWEMPLFHCISDYILDEIENNPKLKQATDAKMEELFGDAMVYASFDDEGKVIATEKILQDTKVKDLLLNFKDMQTKGIVSNLKKESIIDMDIEFKLRRTAEGIYQVEDSEGNSLGKVIRK